jgi:hypothetical protein
VSRYRVTVALTAFLAAAGPLAAQQPGAAPPRVPLRIGPDTLVLRTWAALHPGGWLGPATTPALVTDRWEVETRALIARARADRARGHLLTALGLRPGVPADTGRRRIAIPRPADMAAQPEAPRAFAALGRYADIGLDLRARLEMKLDRLRNAQCTAADVGNPASGCQGGFPTPGFDQQFRVLAGGVLSNRFYVNVDFDTEREFSVNNNINVWYQGLEDEILRRVEVGNVTFRAPGSRFITAGIPSNSFGIMADAQLGPMEFTGIFAQQKGSSVRTRSFTVGETTTQPVSVEARDLDYESGRFFYVLDPLTLAGYPDIDILSINRELLPPEQQLTGVRIYRLRAQAGNQGTNANLGGIDAVAVRDDSQQRVGPFTWELLVEGLDYYLDPSGVWFAMASRIGTDDFLAVSYTTASGDTVGTFPAVNETGDTLQLIYEPRRGTDVPTFFYEMRNVYRIGGSGIERASLELTIVVNESERPLGGEGTYLSALGLALSTDQSTIDEFNRVFPRLRDPNNGAPIHEMYVVFPHATPFDDSVRLQPGDLNDSLYKTPTYLRLSEGPPPKFNLRFRYEATGAGDRSTLSLGAIQVRDRSEKLFIGNRELVRGADYTMDYQLGMVTFLNPDSLFVGPTEVRAQFEENQLFDVAPQTLMGLAATYNLTRNSRIHVIGMLQRDRTTFTRPQLGFEPQAGFIGGVSAELLFRGEGLTTLLNALPLIETTTPSRIEISGEVALSKPNPNRTGTAYVDDFQGQASVTVSLLEREFQLGSMPTSGQGLPPSYLGGGGEFVMEDAVPMVWQNLVQTATGALDFQLQEIDSTVVLVGSGVQTEPVLWLSFKPDTVGGAPDPVTGEPRWFLPHTPGPRWRSISQPFGFGSGVGIDLSRVEFFEFWVLEDAVMTARAQNAVLVFDFGAVQEDVVGTAPESFRAENGDTTFNGFRVVGLDVLDSEKDSVTNTYNALVDDIGILGDLLDSIVDENTGDAIRDFAMCDLGGAAGLPVFPLGDLETICTRRNSRLSTEDLNGDNRLDKVLGVTEENLFRYVFPIGDEQFHVRDGVTHLDGLGRPLTWRLYRIPFRVDTAEIGQPNIRQVQALRMTMVTPDLGGAEEEFWVAMARLRLVGAPWIKRSDTPIAGISGEGGEFHGEVRVTVASTEDQQLGYEPPPGTTNLPEQTGQAFGFGLTQINEASLRVLAFDLREGERAEALIRFTGEADKNLLSYRKMRVWARGRGAGWAEGDLEFYIKAGHDQDNFYMYRLPVRTDSWEPEIVVDLERWLVLRALIEETWLSGVPPTGSAECGGDSTAYVACDGPYLVHVKDPGISPPNLARVSEMATGILRVAETVTADPAELWVDDIRMSDVVDDAGYATALDVRLAAADVFELDLGFSRRDDRFRQLDQRPTYVTDAALRIGGVFRVDKLLPQAWGLSVPFTLSYTRSSADPFFLNNSDILADALTSLREPKASATLWDITLRRVKRGEAFWERMFLDPVVLQVRGQNGSGTTSLNTATTRNRQYRIGYALSPGAQTIAGAPGFLVNLVNSLPGWIKNSEFGEALRTSRLRWNPLQLTFASTLTNNRTERRTFRVPVTLPSDETLPPLPSVVHTWRNDLGFNFRPYSSLALRVQWSGIRDLQDYGDTTVMGRLIEQDRQELFGADVGFARLRTLNTSLNVAPAISSWLRPRFVLATTYAFNRDPNQPRPVRVEGDTAGAFKVPETLTNSRRVELGSSIDLARLVLGIVGDSGFVASLFRGILPADYSYERRLRSSFDRAPFSADLGYRLALGGLDDFRQQEGVPATSAGETDIYNITAGTRLPLGGQLRLNYRNAVNTGWSRRGNIQSEIVDRNREWPSLNFSFAYSPTWALRSVIANLTAQLQYRIVRTSTTQPPALGFGGGSQGAPVTTENNTTMLAPSLTLSLPVGIILSGQYTTSESERVTSGNITESKRDAWSGSANFSWRFPQGLIRLRNRIQTTLSYNVSILAVCILQTGAEMCRTVSDSRRDQVNFRMDTGVSESLRAGLTFSYVVSDQRHLSQKLTQMIFTVYGELSFRAGQLR